MPIPSTVKVTKRNFAYFNQAETKVNFAMYAGIAKNTLDQIAVYTREIVKKALSVWPALAAKCSGVHPYLSFELTSAPSSTRYLIVYM